TGCGWRTAPAKDSRRRTPPPPTSPPASAAPTAPSATRSPSPARPSTPAPSATASTWPTCSASTATPTTPTASTARYPPATATCPPARPSTSWRPEAPDDRPHPTHPEGCRPPRRRHPLHPQAQPARQADRGRLHRPPRLQRLVHLRPVGADRPHQGRPGVHPHHPPHHRHLTTPPGCSPGEHPARPRPPGRGPLTHHRQETAHGARTQHPHPHRRPRPPL